MREAYGAFLRASREYHLSDLGFLIGSMLARPISPPPPPIYPVQDGRCLAGTGAMTPPCPSPLSPGPPSPILSSVLPAIVR